MGYKKLSKLFLFGILIFAQVKTFSQSDLASKIDSINAMSEITAKPYNDVVKFTNNEMIIEALYSLMIEKESINYSFDSLKSISCITPPDKSFRLFTWSFPKEDGYYENSGLIQCYDKRRRRFFIVQLKDISSQISGAEFQKLEGEQWYGATYYKMIEFELNKKQYYILLGWNGNSPFTQKKIIEILSFKNNGMPIWGATLLKKHEKGKIYRLIFEYSKKTSMLLRYDKQAYTVRTNKRDSRTKKPILKSIKSNMIIFDRLAPLNEYMKGVYEYYVPQSDIFDAFVLNDGRWYFFADVDARNPDRRIPKSLRKQLENQPRRNREFYNPKNQ